MKTRWLDRTISAPGPYLCLCLSEKEYLKALRHLKVDPVDDWIKTSHANATCHLITCKTGLAAVVCLNNEEEREPSVVMGLLIHEAVHVWQEWCDYYGESNPSSEQMAYGIQAISQRLIAEYERRQK